MQNSQKGRQGLGLGLAETSNSSQGCQVVMTTWASALGLPLLVTELAVRLELVREVSSWTRGDPEALLESEGLPLTALLTCCHAWLWDPLATPGNLIEEVVNGC